MYDQIRGIPRRRLAVAGAGNEMRSWERVVIGNLLKRCCLSAFIPSSVPSLDEVSEVIVVLHSLRSPSLAIVFGIRVKRYESAGIEHRQLSENMLSFILRRPR